MYGDNCWKKKTSYDESNILWTFQSELSGFFFFFFFFFFFLAAKKRRPETFAALHFCKYWFTRSDLWSRWYFCLDFNANKAILMGLNSPIFKVCVCENRKRPVLCWKHHLFHHFALEPRMDCPVTWQNDQCFQICSRYIFSSLFVCAWKQLPGYFLFLLSIDFSDTIEVLDINSHWTSTWRFISTRAQSLSLSIIV